jgi:hypothetical protein
LRSLHKFECAECKVLIDTFWDDNEDGTTNGLLKGDYVLVADWIYHPHCWGHMYERYVESIKENNE